MRDLLFRTRVPAGVEEEHMLVERPRFELVNPWLVDKLSRVDLHDSQNTFFDNWLAVNQMHLLLDTVVGLITDLINLGMASHELYHQLFSQPVSELKRGRLNEFISEVEITLANRSLLVYLEVIDPGFLFSLNQLVFGVAEPKPVHLTLLVYFHII